MMSKQNILINNEWYTKVFYQGHDCIEPKGNTEYSTGVKCFHNYAKRLGHLWSCNFSFNILWLNVGKIKLRDQIYEFKDKRAS